MLRNATLILLVSALAFAGQKADPSARYFLPCASLSDEALAGACRLQIDAVAKARRRGVTDWRGLVTVGEPLSGEIRRVIEGIAWDDASLLRVPSVAYKTSEKVYADEYLQALPPSKSKHVEAKVFLFEGERFDVWFARHREMVPPTALASVLIVVDKSRYPRQSYFFSALAGSIPKGRAPVLVPHIENCLMCHANGPRLIRTEAKGGTDRALSPLVRRRIDSFNAKMIAYVRTDSHFGTRNFLPPLPKSAYEPLRHRACVDCHGENTLRNPLRRLHFNEIWAMVNSETLDSKHTAFRNSEAKPALMPLEGPRLTKAELECLRGWLNQKPGLGCNDRGEVATGEPLLTLETHR